MESTAFVQLTGEFPERTCFSVLQLPTRAQQRIAERAEHQVENEEEQGAYLHRRVGDAEEAEAEPGNDVEKRVGVAHRLEGGGQAMDRVEGAGKQGQWRDDEIGDGRRMVELL